MVDTEDTEGHSRALPEKKKRRKGKNVTSEYVFYEMSDNCLARNLIKKTDNNTIHIVPTKVRTVEPALNGH